MTPPLSLTHNHEDKQGGGDPRSDVEHDTDVVPQLVQIIHVRHKHGWNQEPDGDAQLQQTRRKSAQMRLLITLLYSQNSACNYITKYNCLHTFKAHKQDLFILTLKLH